MRLLALLLALAAPAAFAGTYGSIAYSPSTGASATSWNYSCASEAETAAIGACGDSSCQAQVWLSNTCGAYAHASNGASGWATNGNRWLARGTALLQCTSAGGTDCTLVTDVCTG